MTTALQRLNTEVKKQEVVLIWTYNYPFLFKYLWPRGLLNYLYFSRTIMIRTTTQTRVTTRTTRTTTRTTRRATITTMTTTVRGRISKSSRRLEAVKVLEKRTLDKAFRRGSERFCSAERSGGWSSVFLSKQNSQQSALLYVSRPIFFLNTAVYIIIF